jgi:amidase
MAPFNRLNTTAAELRSLYFKGKLTSVDALTAYLEQIDKHNEKLKAVIAHPPRDSLFERAKLLDDERQLGKLRGPLHGIPILIKDCIDTPGLGVGTTSGCYSLVGAKARQDAEVVRRLLDAGVIVIGKANLSEGGGWKGTGLPCGWSALGGQTLSPYVQGGLVEDGGIGSHNVRQAEHSHLWIHN